MLYSATTLASKLVEAKLKSQLHSEEFQVFSENLGPVTREGWNDMIINWENDRTLPDPFLVKNECMCDPPSSGVTNPSHELKLRHKLKSERSFSNWNKGAHFGWPYQPTQRSPSFW